jgi:antitoxin (DNA-binding transcriptional repressor) of toxin-antitoxin stability system
VKAGIRQVKNRLSYYLRRVREGELVEVTDRGEVVAELRAPRRKRGRSGRSATLRELADEGVLTLPQRRGRLEDFEPVKPRKPFSISKMILEDRR